MISWLIVSLDGLHCSNKLQVFQTMTFACPRRVTSMISLTFETTFTQGHDYLPADLQSLAV